MLLVTLLASGIAWASIDCNAKTSCKGNDKPNLMFGSGGADIMRGFGGADSMDGDLGNDQMYGGTEPMGVGLTGICSAASAMML